MRLNLKQAKELSIKHWTWMAETGGEFKADWPDFDKYGDVACHCFLCEYADKHHGCRQSCPYHLKFGPCYWNTLPYFRWECAETKEERKKCARLFLEQLKQL